MSNWLDVDWSSTRLPTETQREQSLERLAFRPVRVVAQPVLDLVEAFRTMLTNGGAHVAGFDVVGSDDVAAWFISRNRQEYGLADRLVRSRTFAEAVPDVATPGLAAPTGFERSSSLTLDGMLARSLQWGGAYTDPAMPGAQAKAMVCVLRQPLRRPLRRGRRRPFECAVVVLVQGSRVGRHLGRHRPAPSTRDGPVHHRCRLTRVSSPPPDERPAHLRPAMVVR